MEAGLRKAANAVLDEFLMVRSSIENKSAFKGVRFTKAIMMTLQSYMFLGFIPD